MKNLTVGGLKPPGEGQGDRQLYIFISIIIGKHMKMFYFKFQQICTINEEFNFFEGEEGPAGKM